MHRHGADIAQQIIARGIKRGSQLIEIKNVGETRVKNAILNRVAHISWEPCAVQKMKFQIRLIWAKHALSDDLPQQTRRDHIEIRVIFNVLNSGSDRCLIELFSGNSVKQCDLKFRSNLSDLRNRVRKSLSRALESLINSVCVIGNARTVTLRDVNSRRGRRYCLPIRNWGVLRNGHTHPSMAVENNTFETA